MFLESTVAAPDDDGPPPDVGVLLAQPASRRASATPATLADRFFEARSPGIERSLQEIGPYRSGPLIVVLSGCTVERARRITLRHGS